MTNDKSIDGLSTHAAKTSVKKNIPKKTSMKKSAKAPKATVSHIVKQSTQPKNPSPKSTTPEDFASASTANIWDSIDLNPDEESLTIEDFEDTSTEATVPHSISAEQDKNTTASFLKPIQAFDFDEKDGLTESDETVADLRKSNNSTEEELDESEKNMPKKSKSDLKLEKKLQKKQAKLDKKINKKPSKKRKIITTVALIIVLILIGGTLWLTFWGNDILAKITGGRGNLLDLFSFTTETYDPLKTDENGRTNILAFGTGGYDMNGEEGGGVHDGAQLTDSIMLISFDQKTGDIAMISLPRDLKGPSTCTATGKINEVYWCNGGGGDASIEQEETAATALMEAVGSILGVDIQYYAHLNWGSLASIVDLLGGITVTLDEDINDYYYTEAVYEAGKPYTINGAEAVGLARARHGTTGGDFSRGASQQKIIIGIKDKILEKSLSLTDILGLINTLGDNLRTNFSVSELKTIAHMPEILDFDVMRQISLYPDYMTTGTLNGISYVLPSSGVGNYGAIQAFLAKQLSSDPRDYEEPTIAIYNASDTVGLASNEKAKLEEKGYTITTIDNAPEGEYDQGTAIYAISTTKPGTKALLEEEYSYEPKTTAELPTTIEPKYDFIIILNDQNNNK